MAAAIKNRQSAFGREVDIFYGIVKMGNSDGGKKHASKFPVLIEDWIAKIDRGLATDTAHLEITDGKFFGSEHLLEIGAVTEIGRVGCGSAAKDRAIGFDQAKGGIIGQYFAKVGKVAAAEGFVGAQGQPGKFCERGEQLPCILDEVLLICGCKIRNGLSTLADPVFFSSALLKIAVDRNADAGNNDQQN